MKVYVVSYGWMSDADGIRPMTPKVFYSDTGPNGAKAFCDEWLALIDEWLADCASSLDPFAFYDEIEVE